MSLWSWTFLFLNMMIWIIADAKEKSVIEYLGTVYIMPDGCPTPDCDTRDPECVRTKRWIDYLYYRVIQSKLIFWNDCYTSMGQLSSNVTTTKSLGILSRNLRGNFFLKIGILSVKVYTKKVPNIEECNFIHASLRIVVL